MLPVPPDAASRRAFLRFLAGSPLLTFGFGACTSDGDASADAPPIPPIADPLHPVIASAEEAINVFDFEAAARAALPPAHFGYIATGVDDDATLRENHDAYRRLKLRPRRLVDVSRVDTRVRLFDVEWDAPIVIAPAGSQRAFHDEGELATARAANAQRTLQILSSVTSTSVEDVSEARGEPVWYQLYPTARWEVTERVMQRVNAVGCPVVVLTVDTPTGSNRESLARWSRTDERDCTACHAPGKGWAGKPMYDGTGLAGEDFYASAWTWETVDRLRDLVPGRLVLKGIVTTEDARLCVQHGVDGIIVSNHGGRSEESGRATIDSLPEVVAAVDGRIPVLVDGGIRRGTDVLKAIAFGADAVCIGRPYLWGLGAFGQAGVERVLSILRTELEIAMRLAGAPSLGALDPSFLMA